MKANATSAGRRLYAKRPDAEGEGLWEVYYIPTGRVVVTEGPLSQLDEHDADEAVGLLQAAVEEDW